jgi:nucleotide-binding universal stress UspA family protein
MSPTSSQVAFQRILVPLDLSVISVAALPFAVGMAGRYGAKLLITHFLPESEYRHTGSSAKSAVLERLRPVLESMRGVSHEVLIEHGDVVEKLPSLVAQTGTDLVVLGAHGSHGLEKLVRGSVAQEIMCSCQIPVLAVGAEVSRQPEFKNILYATDFSAASEAAFICAVSVADHFNSSLVFLHVNEWNSQEPPIQAEAKTLEFFERHVSDVGVHTIDLHRDVLVKYGARADQILDVARRRASDLIVMGMHCKHGLRARVSAHLPGPVSYAVTSEAPCPVLAVPSATH